jgi:GTPase KRas protein
LLGNKCDVDSERTVSMEEGVALARRYNCPFLETSARTGENVERAFSDLVRMLRDRQLEFVEVQVDNHEGSVELGKKGCIKCVLS